MAFPSSVPIRAAQIRSIVPVIRNSALDGSEYLVHGASQYFGVSLSLVNLTQAQSRAVMGHIASAGGGVNSFEIVLPGDLSDTSTGRTDSLITGGGTVGDTVLGVIGGPLNTTVLNAGDYIKFANGSKVYQVTADVTTDGSGTGVLNIFPGLLTNESTSTAITTNDVPFTVRYSVDATEFAFGLTQYGSIDLDLKEVI